MISDIISHTDSWLDANPNHPERDNIKQYTEVETLRAITSTYKKALSVATGRILDVGSGCGFAKLLDKNIKTANMETLFFNYMEEKLDVPHDYTCYDCTKKPQWIDTDEKFDTILLIRFLPWYGTVLDRSTRHNVLGEVNRLLNAGGQLIYNCGGDPQSVLTWKKYDYFYVIPKHQIENEIFYTQAT